MREPTSRWRDLRLLYSMSRIAASILTLVVAAMAAIVFGSIAHYGLGIARADLRVGALGVASFIALGLVGDTLFKRK